MSYHDYFEGKMTACLGNIGIHSISKNSRIINWIENLQLDLIGISLKSIQSSDFRIEKSGISTRDILWSFE
jgi:hypothetical protein